MSNGTKIEWAEATWNPVTGCTKVSPGCDRCYAETFAERWRGIKGHHFENGFDVQLREDKLLLPLRWKKGRRVFVNSMSDLFHKDVPDEYIARVFAIMALTPQHTYQLLTKRHARMRSVLQDICKCGRGHAAGVEFRSAMAWACSKANPDRIQGLSHDAEHRVYFDTPWPLPNVHLGVSVENQKWADIRIPALLETPAAVRWVSAEPLLGPVTLFEPDHKDHERDWDGADWVCLDCSTGGKTVPWRVADRSRLGIDWVVCGGESGPGARPMHPDWARSLRDQCAAADVPFLFKQHGDWIERGALPSDDRLSSWDEKRVLYVHPQDGRTQTHGEWDMRDHLEGWAIVQRVGKKRAGRELDGQVWDQYPGGAR